MEVGEEEASAVWQLYTYSVVVNYFGNNSDATRMWARFKEHDCGLVNLQFSGNKDSELTSANLYEACKIRIRLSYKEC